MLKARIIVGLIAIPFIISLLFLKIKLPFIIFVILILFIGLIEFFKMISRKIQPFWISGLVSGAIVLLFSLTHSFSMTVVLIIVFFIIAIERVIQSKQDIENVLLSILVTFFGIFYVCILGSYIIHLYKVNTNMTFFLICAVWSYDSGAYFTGTLLGKKHIFKTISPNKTLEGVLGGVVFALLLIMILKAFGLFPLSYILCVILTIYLCIIAQIGDLSESLLKRFSDVKDSGNLIPGHGGILDKIDSFIFAAPMTYYCFIIFK